MNKFDINTIDDKFVVLTMEELGEYITDMPVYRSMSVDNSSLKGIYNLVYTWLDEIQVDMEFINFHVIEGAGAFFIFKKIV